MAKVQEMTQLSPTMTEGTIVKWIKKEGDSISPGDILAEVETDKAVMEMEAYDSGVLLKIIQPEGSKLKVGEAVAVVGKPGEDINELLKKEVSTVPSGWRRQMGPVALLLKWVNVPATISLPACVPDRISRNLVTRALAPLPQLKVKS